MGLGEMVQTFTALPASTKLLYIFTAVVLWIVVVRFLQPQGKSKEEMDKEMAKSSAQVKIRIQWCGG